MENGQRQAAKRGAPTRAGRMAAMPGHSVPAQFPGPLFPERADGIGGCGRDWFAGEGPGRCGMGAALRSTWFLRPAGPRGSSLARKRRR
ncbi:MAG: hypothetical protein ABSD38_10540 [Syntrophorhabdales bacterium]